MKLSRCATCAASAFLAVTLVSGAAPERTVSTSRQFIVYGADVSLRGAISRRAEETKANLLSLLRRPDSWKTPIVINLQFPRANLPEVPPAALHFSQTGFGLKLQLDLIIAPNFNSAATERELLRAILLEMIYRDRGDIAAGTAYVDPPEWLLDGALAHAADRDSKPLAEALEPLVGNDKIMPLSEFLRPRKLAGLDSPARILYRAYSAAFVKWLVDEPEGQSRLGLYIDNLSRNSAEPLAGLKAHFAALNDPAVEQIWKTRVMRFCNSQSYRLLTFEETQQRLDEILAIKVAARGNESSAVKLEDLSRRRLSHEESTALEEMSRRLLFLGLSSNPVLRPIITEYQQVAALLAAGKRSRTGERLARLRVLRANLAIRMSKIDDYLNWFEATQARTKSGAFENYLNAVEQQSDVAPRRHDAISVYLDALAEQFQN
jgi:hypothetical protein